MSIRNSWHNARREFASWDWYSKFMMAPCSVAGLALSINSTISAVSSHNYLALGFDAITGIITGTGVAIGGLRLLRSIRPSHQSLRVRHDCNTSLG